MHNIQLIIVQRVAINGEREEGGCWGLKIHKHYEKFIPTVLVKRDELFQGMIIFN